MKVQHDRDADAVYIEFSEAQPLYGIDLPGVDGISVDIDEAGRLVGIEILGATRLLGDGLNDLCFEDLVAEWSTSLALTGKRRKVAPSKPQQ